MQRVITSKNHWFRINFQELSQYKDLFYFLTWRDIKVRYKQTVVGVAWAVFQPLITMIIFSLFFGNFAKIPSDNIPYPIFVYIGLLYWTLFSQSLTTASNSLVGNEQIIKKIYFPKILLPASAIFVSVIDFLVAAVLLIGMMLYYHFTPTVLGLLWLLVFMVVTYIASFGLGLLLAAVKVKFRDVQYVLPFFIQLLLFLTPVIYPTSLLSSQNQWFIFLNPMSGIIENARQTLLNLGEVNWQSLGIALGVSVIFLIVGLVYFRKTERYFADII